MEFEAWRAASQPDIDSLLIKSGAELGDSHREMLAVDRIVIEFESFMDGRGFSHARRLRELGYEGEIAAAGDILPDQWQYLERCGFSRLADADLHAQALSLTRFSDAYQRDTQQPRPMFLRRS